MPYEISDAQVTSFRSHGYTVGEAYLGSKGWQRIRGDGPRNIWYRQKVAKNLCPYCDDPDGLSGEDPYDPYCPVHDDATWALLWPCVGEAGNYDALHTLCRVEDRGPEEILHALTLRDRDEVRAKSTTPLWKQFGDPLGGIDFFLALDKALALASGGDASTLDEDPYELDSHSYRVELASENEVLFTFPHDQPPRPGIPPTESRRAAERLYSAAPCQEPPSDRWTHVPARYATGEWTTVEVMGPEDLPPPTLLQDWVESLAHKFDLITWTYDPALPSERSE
jgi:hypothetical protein